MYIGEPVVLPDQLVGPVVFIGDGSRPPGYGANTPIVVVGVSVGGVAAVLIADQQGLKTLGLPNRAVKGTIP